MDVGNIIIPYAKVVEKLGEPVGFSWKFENIIIVNVNTEIDMKKNKVWVVRGKNRDDLHKVGALFQKSERIIF